MLTKNKIFDLLNYPEKAYTASLGEDKIEIKVYGNESSYNRMAMISHFLHNSDLPKGKERTAKKRLYQYISSIHPEYDDEYTNVLCDNAVQLRSCFEMINFNTYASYLPGLEVSVFRSENLVGNVYSLQNGTRRPKPHTQVISEKSLLEILQR